MGLSAAFFVVLAVMASPPRADAAGPLLFPAPSGSQWQIVAGYNTATHSVADANDPYAIDIVRTDAPTEGTRVLAPMDGTIRFSGSNCVSISDAARNSVMMCHIFPVATSTSRNQPVTRGQWIGTVAPPGQANNNGLAHIHMAVSDASRLPIPFDGVWAIEGQSLPAITTSNGYAGTRFNSTNTPALTVSAGADLQVRPEAAVTLAAQANVSTSITYAWRQISGPSVSLALAGASASFTAPGSSGATLVFEVVAVNPQAQTASATVTVRTSTNAPPPAGTTGAFVAPPVFGALPLALVVYAGGSVDQLEAAARSAGATGVWVQDVDGSYRLLVVDGPAFLNDAFRARFAGGFATATAVTLTRPAGASGT